MEFRPPKEARIFHEGPGIRLVSHVPFSPAKISKLFHAYHDQLSLQLQSAKKYALPPKSMFEHVDLTALREEPVRYLSFDPLRDVEYKRPIRVPRQVWAGFASVLIIGFGLYQANAFTKTHILPWTKVGGQSIGLMTKQRADYLLRADVEKFSVTLKTTQGSITPTPSEVGVRFDIDKTLQVIMHDQASSGLGGTLQFWRGHSYDYSVDIDEAKVASYFAVFEKPIDQPVRNASFILKDGALSIVPDYRAQVDGYKDPLQVIRQAAMHLHPIVMQVETYIQKPTITSEDLRAIAPRVEGLLKTPLLFTLDKVAFSPTKQQLLSWITYAPNKDAGGLNLDVDTSRVRAYLDSAVKPYLKTPHPSLTIGLDGVIKQVTAGIDGFNLADEDQITTKIAEALKSTTPLRYDLPIESAVHKTIAAGNSPKWLDVNLTTRQVTAYEQQQSLKTFAFSAGQPATPTVKGSFQVTTKNRTQDRYGLGVPNNFLPQVEFVTYFYQDFAFEAGTTQSLSSFGKVDTTSGSIDMATQDAAWIYNWATIGTPVLVHD